MELVAITSSNSPHHRTGLSVQHSIMLSLQPLPVAQGGCWSAGHQHQLSPPRTLLVCRSSKQPRRDDTLRSLDALLPTAPPPVDAATPPPPPQSDSGDGYAWFDRPASAQTNPLRTRGMEVRRQPASGQASARRKLACKLPAALPLPCCCRQPFCCGMEELLDAGVPKKVYVQDLVHALCPPLRL